MSRKQLSRRPPAPPSASTSDLSRRENPEHRPGCASRLPIFVADAMTGEARTPCRYVETLVDQATGPGTAVFHGASLCRQPPGPSNLYSPRRWKRRRSFVLFAQPGHVRSLRTWVCLCGLPLPPFAPQPIYGGSHSFCLNLQAEPYVGNGHLSSC